MVYPKVSLILTTLNSLDNFTKTFSSIKEQNYPNIEIIVVDGGFLCFDVGPQVQLSVLSGILHEGGHVFSLLLLGDLFKKNQMVIAIG